ncbi:MAG: hypothetical protein HYY06_25250 [Deltaproteobacteria bacterium]|nr:hypothetical protein [Deltaproteobacteria bacterium]
MSIEVAVPSWKHPRRSRQLPARTVDWSPFVVATPESRTVGVAWSG